ncbi:MAG: tetratricopeptide repeat protein [Polyangiales bacterium]
MTASPMLRSSLAFAALVGIVLAFVPLLAVHGVESALALGLLLPPWAAANAAGFTVRNRGVRGIDLVLRAVGMGLLIWLIPLLILALSSLRIRQCAPAEGLTFMILGPAIGCALAASVGVWVGALVGRPRLAPWLAAAIPIGAALLGLWTFYTTPTVYVFGAFAGYFPGAIYDDLVQIPTRYLTYRATMLVALLALGVLFDALWDPTTGRLSIRGRSRAGFGAIAVGLGALGFVAASYALGNELGHRVSKEHLVERLGKTERGRHCIVHMPRETRPEDAARLIEDCDFQVSRLRSLVGLKSEEPVTAYFFRNQNEKKGLIGVGRTLIAKPWRREVYLQVSRWPHPVLGHEIVHAALAEVGKGPFAVSGALGGLIPNPGIVEGAAVALAWDLRDDLDPDQWSRIMMDRNELPSAESVMSVRFSTLPARRAYMAAGSMMRFLIASRGMSEFLETYRRGNVEDLPDLESKWREYLAEIPVSDHERGIAEVELARSSIFSSVCPHELAKLRANLAGDMAARDDGRTIETCEAILDINETEAQARAALVGALARSGQTEAAAATLDGLRAAMNAPKPIVAAALEQYADASWTLGKLDEASALYDELLSLPRTDGPARQGEVKRLALEASDAEREIVYEMLLSQSPSPVVVHLAQTLASLRSDGLGQYLEARQLLGQNRYALALPLLQESQQLGLPTPRLERELGRLLGVTHFALGNYADAGAAWRKRSSISRAAEAEAQRWLERIEYAETQSVSPALPGPSSAPQAAP